MKNKIYLFSILLFFGFQFSKAENRDSIAFSHIIKIEPGDSEEVVKTKAAHVIPNKRQSDGLDNEFIAFFHFGPNTFSGREWGTGMEETTVFNPSEIDTEQWVRTAKDAGMKLVILTAKHHDGYVLWQSKFTDHGIMGSPYKNGKGDVLKELSEACQKYGMKLGIYLSPADLYQIESPDGLYGNGSEKSLRKIGEQFEFVVDDYNEYYMNQLVEILSNYGPIHEVWFDGANPKEKGGQTYDYDAWLEIVHTLAPEAVTFGAGDVRWCGNEAGDTRDTEWNVVPFMENPEKYTKFGLDQAEDIGSLNMLKNANYITYLYPETDTSIRDGWFYYDDSTQYVKTADEVFDIYERSVGGNSVFLLNLPPNKEGKLGERDVATLSEVGRRIRSTYSKNLLENSSAPEVLLDNNKLTGIPIEDELIVEIDNPITINRIVLQEAVPVSGERVAAHSVDAFLDGEWKEIAKATNIGNKRILRFPDVTTDRLRVRVTDSRLTPTLSTLSAHYYNSPD